MTSWPYIVGSLTLGPTISVLHTGIRLIWTGITSVISNWRKLRLSVEGRSWRHCKVQEHHCNTQGLVFQRGRGESPEVKSLSLFVPANVPSVHSQRMFISVRVWQWWKGFCDSLTSSIRDVMTAVASHWLSFCCCNKQQSFWGSGSSGPGTVCCRVEIVVKIIGLGKLCLKSKDGNNCINPAHYSQHCGRLRSPLRGRRGESA